MARAMMMNIGCRVFRRCWTPPGWGRERVALARVSGSRSDPAFLPVAAQALVTRLGPTLIGFHLRVPAPTPRVRRGCCVAIPSQRTKRTDSTVRSASSKWWWAKSSAELESIKHDCGGSPHPAFRRPRA